MAAVGGQRTTVTKTRNVEQVAATPSREVETLPHYAGQFVAWIERWSGSFPDLAYSVDRALRNQDRAHLEYVDAAIVGRCQVQSNCPAMVAVAQVQVRHLLDDWKNRHEDSYPVLGYAVAMAAALLSVLGSLAAVILSGWGGRRTSERMVTLLGEISTGLQNGTLRTSPPADTRNLPLV